MSNNKKLHIAKFKINKNKLKTGKKVSESKFATRDSSSYINVPEKWKEKSIDLEREEFKLQLFHKKLLFFISLLLIVILFLCFIVFLAMFWYSGINEPKPFYKLIKDVPYLIIIILALCLAPITIICSLIKNVFKEKFKNENDENALSNNPSTMLVKELMHIITNKN